MVIDSSDLIVALIGVGGVLLGFVLSEMRARIQHQADQNAMLFEISRYLSGGPTEIVTGSSIAIKYQKRNETFHDALIPVLLSISLRFSERELGGEKLTPSEKYALYVVWCVLGSIWTTRDRHSRPELGESFAEFKRIEELFLQTQVGQQCNSYAETKEFGWLAPTEKLQDMGVRLPK